MTVTTFEEITIEKLYEWARENNLENLRIALQYQDEGGTYWDDTISDSNRNGEITIFAKTKDNGEQYIVLE